jgi:hypothetical protein
MKTKTLSANGFESTYALLVRSEEKDRSVCENIAYFVFILSVVFSIWQAARQPVTVPAAGLIHTTSVAQNADTRQS